MNEFMSDATVVPLILTALTNFLQIYLILLLIRVLLTWFPNVDWGNPVFSVLAQLTDPYLNIFRSIIPPIGGLDFSPIIGFFLLQFLVQLLGSFSRGGALF